MNHWKMGSCVRVNQTVSSIQEKKRYKVELEKELSAGNEPTRSLYHTM